MDVMDALQKQGRLGDAKAHVSRWSTWAFKMPPTHSVSGISRLGLAVAATRGAATGIASGACVLAAGARMLAAAAASGLIAAVTLPLFVHVLVPVAWVTLLRVLACAALLVLVPIRTHTAARTCSLGALCICHKVLLQNLCRTSYAYATQASEMGCRCFRTRLYIREPNCRAAIAHKGLIEKLIHIDFGYTKPNERLLDSHRWHRSWMSFGATAVPGHSDTKYRSSM